MEPKSQNRLQEGLKARTRKPEAVVAPFLDVRVKYPWGRKGSTPLPYRVSSQKTRAPFLYSIV